jgi:hypothetical protein
MREKKKTTPLFSLAFKLPYNLFDFKERRKNSFTFFFFEIKFIFVIIK